MESKQQEKLLKFWSAYYETMEKIKKHLEAVSKIGPLYFFSPTFNNFNKNDRIVLEVGNPKIRVQKDYRKNILQR